MNRVILGLFLVMSFLFINISGTYAADDYLNLSDTRLDFQGYLRARYYTFAMDGPDTSLGDIRLRLETRWTLADGIKLLGEFNGLENVVWGQNDGQGQLFSQSVSTQSHGRPVLVLNYQDQ